MQSHRVGGSPEKALGPDWGFREGFLEEVSKENSMCKDWGSEQDTHPWWVTAGLRGWEGGWTDRWGLAVGGASLRAHRGCWAAGLT